MFANEKHALTYCSMRAKGKMANSLSCLVGTQTHFFSTAVCGTVAVSGQIRLTMYTFISHDGRGYS